MSTDQILKDFINQVKHYSYLNQRAEVKNDIDEASKNGNTDIIPKLMEVFNELQKNLKQLEKEMGQARSI